MESLGGRVFDLVVPTPANDQPVAIRSTGASQALQGNPAVLAGLAAAGLVVDCTVEGLLHAPELGTILGGGARVLMISNEHPETFERLPFDPTLAARVAQAHARLAAASTMRVTSAAGTDLTVRLAGAVTAGSTGVTAGPGSIAHWPGGLVLAFPAPGTVAGTVVLAPGDLNLTFKRYLERPVTLTIVDDHIAEIAGDGVDADSSVRTSPRSRGLGRSRRLRVSHAGWGMNPGARWDTIDLYDKNGLQRHRGSAPSRATSSTRLGANEVAGRR